MRIKVIALLLVLGVAAAALVLIPGKEQRTTARLFELLQAEQWDQALALAQSGEFLVQARDARGWTLLHRSNSAALSKLLIERGADVNAQGAGIDPDLAPVRFMARWREPANVWDQAMYELAQKGKNLAPLHAVKDLETARVLLAAGADVNAKAQYDETPLFFARSEALVALLLQAGADVNARGGYNSTVLIDAVDNFRSLQPQDSSAGPFPAIIVTLVQAGADINAQDNGGSSVLNKVTKFHRAELLRYLLEQGADPSLRGSFGNTAFCQAVADDSRHLIVTYLGLYPGLLFEPCKGNTTLSEYAAREANAETIALLQKARAIVEEQMQVPLTPPAQ